MKLLLLQFQKGNQLFHPLLHDRVCSGIPHLPVAGYHAVYLVALGAHPSNVTVVHGGRITAAWRLASMSQRQPTMNTARPITLTSKENAAKGGHSLFQIGASL